MHRTQHNGDTEMWCWSSSLIPKTRSNGTKLCV